MDTGLCIMQCASSLPNVCCCPLHLLWRMARLSLSGWLITYQDGLPACRHLTV